MLFQLQAQNRSAKEIKALSEVIYLSEKESFEYCQSVLQRNLHPTYPTRTHTK